MIRDDIIRMAREAEQPTETCWLAYEVEFLERFAALVAAAEREQCAEMTEDMDIQPPKHIAAAIRARN